MHGALRAVGDASSAVLADLRPAAVASCRIAPSAPVVQVPIASTIAFQTKVHTADSLAADCSALPTSARLVPGTASRHLRFPWSSPPERPGAPILRRALIPVRRGCLVLVATAVVAPPEAALFESQPGRLLSGGGRPRPCASFAASPPIWAGRAGSSGPSAVLSGSALPPPSALSSWARAGWLAPR